MVSTTRAVRALAAAVLPTALFLAGCGGDDSGEIAATSTTEGAERQHMSGYCDLVAAYDDATMVDTSTVESTLAGFEAASTAARAVVAQAPAEIRDAHERLAAGAELLVERLREAAPASTEELSAVGEEVTAGLEAEFGDLEAETEAVTTFAERKCGLTVG